MRKYEVVIFILVSLTVPFAGAADPADTGQAWPIVTSPELNTTGINLTNHSIPSKYEISPTLIDLRVEVPDTLLPGPKGEMVAGPRTIGFSADPLSLAILVIAIAAIASGIWYMVKRKPQENEEEGDEESGK